MSDINQNDDHHQNSFTNYNDVNSNKNIYPIIDQNQSSYFNNNNQNISYESINDSGQNSDEDIKYVEDNSGELLNERNETNIINSNYDINHVIQYYIKTSKLDESGYNVQIGNPIAVGGLFNKIYFYEVKGKYTLGEFNVNRRYNDFVVLNSMLIDNYPGEFIPSLPEKSLNVYYNKEKLNERRLMLELYLTRLLNHKIFGNSKELKEFLNIIDRNHVFFSYKNTKKFDEKLNIEKSYNILDESKLIYGDDIDKEIDLDMISNLKNYKNKLEKLKFNLYEWRYSSYKLLKNQLDMMQSSKAFFKSGENVEDIINFFYIKEMKEIDESQMFKYNDVNTLISKHKFEELIKNFKLLLKIEIRDLESMIKSIDDVLKMYDLSQSKLNKQISIQELIDNASRNNNNNANANEKYIDNLKKEISNLTLEYTSLKNISNVGINIIYNHESQYLMDKNERLYYIKRMITTEFKNYFMNLYDYYECLDDRCKIFYEKVLQKNS